VANANNDVDLDNNGYGSPNSDIKSGIVTLTSGGEPMDDGDPVSCYFDYDGSGNNTVDFGFFNPNVMAVFEHENETSVQLFPNPVRNELTIETNLMVYQIELVDSFGRVLRTIQPTKSAYTIDTSALPEGLYFIKVLDMKNGILKVQKIVKE
jgi:hypothetical protein